MLKDIHLHFIHYIFLISILLGGIGVFLVLRANPEKQFISVIVTATLYVIWGMAHHHLEGDLHRKIVLEYLLIAALSVIIIRGVIFQ